MNKMQFTLAGKIVSKSKEAHDVWLQALRNGTEYLIPQARSVWKQLEAGGCEECMKEDGDMCYEYGPKASINNTVQAV